MAQIQAASRKFDVAEALIADVLRKDSRNVDALRLRAALNLQQGKTDSAIADLREALNEQPRSSDLMLLLATTYERSGSIELAEKQYADATNASNFDPTTGLQYVGFLRRRGNAERAEEVLNELVRRTPENLAVLSAVAETQLARQDWTGAQHTAETIQRVSGSSDTGEKISAAALSGRGDFSDSIRMLETTYSDSKNATPALVTLVNTMVRGKQLDRAVSFLQTVLKNNPNNAEARVLLGSVQLAKNSASDALENFRTAIKQQPKLPAAYVALANYNVRQKNYDEAEKVLHAGLEQNPDDFSIHMTLAATLEAKGDYDKAISEYEYLLKQQPGAMVVANNLASLLTDRRTDKASLDRAYTLAAVLRKSPVPAFKDTLGWIYYLHGEVKDAIPLLEESSKALSNNSAAQYHLGMSYLADGQRAKASEQLKKALALNPDASLQGQIRAAQEKAAM